MAAASEAAKRLDALVPFAMAVEMRGASWYVRERARQLQDVGVPLDSAMFTAMAEYVAANPRRGRADEWVPCENRTYKDPKRPYGLRRGPMCGRPARVYRDDRPGAPSHAWCEACGRWTLVRPEALQDEAPAPADDDGQPWEVF